MADIKFYECTKCENKSIQQKWICPSCKNTEFRTQEVKGEGTVYSHTTIHVSSTEFTSLTPYSVALITLSCGLRVTGRLPGNVEINDQVACVNNDNNTFVFEKI